MCGWVQAVLISALSWGAADTVFDVILDAEPAGNSHDEEKANGKQKADSGHLTHAQTIFLCSVTTFFIILSYAIFIMFTREDYIYYIAGESYFFLNSNYSDRVVLILSGIFCYYHYHFLVKSFEHSSSTVILPFLQFSSIFAFVLSMFQRFFSGQPWLSNKLHLLAYLLILIGGLSPATNGNLMQLFKFKFWNQEFVKYALAADASHAVYTVIVSYIGEGEGSFEFNFFANMEFFILTRMMFVVIQLTYFIRSKRIQLEIISLLYRPKILIACTMLCELFTLIGYFSSVYAYQCYYQPGVVSAAESSLNLISNLFVAYLLKKYYDIGRSASLQNLGLKIFASLLISFGLIIANYE